MEHIQRHDCDTADSLGWAELVNGTLIRAAQDAGFDVLVTADKNMAFQQNLKARKLAIVVLPTNNWKTLQSHITAINNAIDFSAPGSFHYVEC
jgi:hypothetical protein